MRDISASTIDQAAAQLGLELAKAFDDLMRQALTIHLGHSDWTLEELRGRLNEVKRQGEPWSTFFLDEHRLLVLGDTELTPRHGRITATRKVLWTVG